MRSKSTNSVVLTGLVAAVLASYGCGSSGGNTNVFGSGGSNGSGGSASGGASGSGGSGSGSGGSDATGGTTGSGGAIGTGGATPTDGGNDTAAPTDGGGTDVTVPANDITKVRPTAGCGKAPMGTGQQTMVTMGTKPADCADKGGCGPWMYTRNFNVVLPAGYDMTKAYPLVIQGPGCGGGDTNVYSLNGSAVIRVGIQPSREAAVHHATNPGQGCFDDKEGDDSVDWPFYEGLWDKLAGELCFDQNRVFANGDSSGAWFSNEVGCKYAGDAKHPIRGIMPNTGGLPSNPIWVPVCTNSPLAGMWMGDLSDPENPFSNNIFGIQRAMKVNGCATQTYSDANTDPFPIGGGNAANQCKKVKGCPDIYPIIVCTVNNGTHDSHTNMANPGFATFLQLFTKAPFLTP